MQGTSENEEEHMGPQRPIFLSRGPWQRNMNLNDSARGLFVNRLLLKLVMSVMMASLFYSTPAGAQVAPTTKKAETVKITQGPEIERAEPDLTIVRWTTNNPGASPEHYGVVHYGTNPTDLSHTAKNPVTLN